MIVRQDRSQLDAALANPTAIILVLRDAEVNSPGREVHDFFNANPGVWDPWHECFLITDACPLTAKEERDWFNNQKRDRYAVLCLPDANGDRAPGAKGKTSADLNVGGDPDIFRILDALQGCP